MSALETKAQHGDSDAQYALGLQHSNTHAPEQDLALAAQWYRRAADQDHALAQFNLAIMFARGQGVSQNDLTSAAWMRKAAEGGDAGGQYHLGGRCHRASVDPGTPDAAELRVEGYKWLHLAAAQGYGNAHGAWERLTLTMSRAEVDEGNRRAAQFVPRPALQPPQPSSTRVP